MPSSNLLYLANAFIMIVYREPYHEDGPCPMLTPNLAAASLRPRPRFPARNALLDAANYLMPIPLSADCRTILRADLNFLPATREGGAESGSVDREVPRDDTVFEDAA